MVHTETEGGHLGTRVERDVLGGRHGDCVDGRCMCRWVVEGDLSPRSYIDGAGVRCSMGGVPGRMEQGEEIIQRGTQPPKGRPSIAAAINGRQALATGRVPTLGLPYGSSSHSHLQVAAVGGCNTL